MSQPTASKRNRGETEERLIQAAIDILRDRGFDHLGVNAIAVRAGVSKVLIYRYFDSYEGLLRAVADRVTPLDTGLADRIMGSVAGAPSPADVIRQIVRELHRSVADNELLQQILIWELAADNELTAAMAQQREESGLAQTESLRAYFESQSLPPDVDLNALVALVTAGVFYLTLRSRHVDRFNGIDLASEEGWERISSALSSFFLTQ